MKDNRKTALVTGACVNTGVAIVEKLAKEGYHVVFTGRNSESVKEKEAYYKQKFPDAEILGYAIDSLLDERTVDEESVEKLTFFQMWSQILRRLVMAPTWGS